MRVSMINKFFVSKKEYDKLKQQLSEYVFLSEMYKISCGNYRERMFELYYEIDKLEQDIKKLKSKKRRK